MQHAAARLVATANQRVSVTKRFCAFQQSPDSSDWQIPAERDLRRRLKLTGHDAIATCAIRNLTAQFQNRLKYRPLNG